MDNRDTFSARQVLARARMMQKEGMTLDDFILQQEMVISTAQKEHDKLYPYVTAAQKKYISNEGEIEVDDEAVVSAGFDDGAYVQAWVWITNAEAGLPPRHECWEVQLQRW